jgi:hypothetical protein
LVFFSRGSGAGTLRCMNRPRNNTMSKRWAPVIAIVVALAAAAVTHSSRAASVTQPTTAPAPVVAATSGPEVQHAPAVARRTDTPMPREHHGRLGAGQGVRVLAGRECREDAVEDAAEFRLKYGEGRQALRRCTAHKLAKARAECREEAREDPLDYRQDYGTGARALRRCVRDELS